jgi:FKBP-type peptidyl-prolyl cis-trans isomerase FklB
MRATALLLLLLSSRTLLAQTEIPHADTADSGRPALRTQLDSVSYAVGLNLGVQTLSDSVVLNGEALLAGLRDAHDTTRALLNAAQIAKVLSDIQMKVLTDNHRRDSIASIAHRDAGERYLTENKTRPGVITLSSGLQYEVITEGSGRRPTATDTVVVHYTGMLIDGSVFDSSVERREPATLAVDSVIPGWTEALQKMKVGSKWRIFIPSDLAYGPLSAGEIPGNSAVIFDIELLKVKAAGTRR